MISEYLFSTSSSNTKLVFAIYSISLSRLIDHFGDNEPKKVKTMISFYLNWHARMEKNNAIENIKKKLADQIKELKKIANQSDTKIKKSIDNIKEVLEDQKEELVKIIFILEMDKINNKIIEIKKALLYQINMMNLYSKMMQNNETIDRIDALEKILSIIGLNTIRNKLFKIFILLQDFQEK
ncbi:9622_t:CDS:1 [Gigaspora margarita]|uniref:9622_t:CDS:1 n=1 Tax=Gigaspora margarita TaxID=4874 RepID=A0ABN7UY40_GIGMA|nr:9622_t:CDS:1 [Gigaspora margarita]